MKSYEEIATLKARLENIYLREEICSGHNFEDHAADREASRSRIWRTTK
jgi:hypothetical protein